MGVLRTVDSAPILGRVVPREDVGGLVLFDLDMPRVDWHRALVGLVAEGAPVVVVSSSVDAAAIGEAMAMGAAAFVPKVRCGGVMLGALRQVLAAGIGQPLAALPASSPRSLTRRQLDVLSLLADGRSNKEIARALGLAEGTVKLHVTAILKSFQANNRTQAVRIAWLSGVLAEKRTAHH